MSTEPVAGAGVVGEGVQQLGGVAELIEQDGGFGDRVGGVLWAVTVDQEATEPGACRGAGARDNTTNALPT